MRGWGEKGDGDGCSLVEVVPTRFPATHPKQSFTMSNPRDRQKGSWRCR